MSSAVAEKADKVYRNGKIVTVDDKFSIAQAMAVKGDRFIYVGSDAGIEEHIGDNTDVVDLEGKTVTPGLIDSHMHPNSMAERIIKGGLDVRGLDMETFRKAIAAEIEKVGPGNWVTGRAYTANTLGVEPHKKYLDEVSPNNPVFLRDGSYHAGWVNSKALEIAGITDETPQPKGGHIERDVEGRATGHLMEQNAIDLVYTKIPQSFTDDEQNQGEILASKELLAVGLTGVHDASRPEIGLVNRRKALYQNGKIKIRMNTMLSVNAARELGGPQIGLYNHRLGLNTVKILLDGATGPRSAALIRDYSDMPGWKGVLIIDPDEYMRQVIESVKLGYTVHTHTIGDLAIRTAMDAYEKAIMVDGVRNRRLSTAHNHIPTPDDLPRYGKLGMVANGTPLWGVRGVSPRYGEERCHLFHAFKSWIDAGAVVVFGTDHPVSPYNPWPNLRAAITRSESKGAPPFNPEQCLSREQALRCYTINCAYMTFEEGIKGSIEVGKLADFVVIDRDYMAIPADEIGDIKVLMTVVGGEVVHEAS